MLLMTSASQRVGASKFKNFKAAIEDSQWQRASEEMMDSRWASQTPERAERLRDRVIDVSTAENVV